MNTNLVSLKASLLYLLLLLSVIIHAQTAQLNMDSTSAKKNGVRKWSKVVALPLVLFSAGLLASTDNEVIDRYEINVARQKHIPHFHTHIDDYLQYAPIAAVYGLNLAGIKGKNDFANRTVLIIKSEIIMMAMVIPLKKFTAVPRPDTGAPTSFPSGHTAQAFAAATFVHKEYGKDHPLYSVLAYTAATGVGVLRVMNNRHWTSDILAGAAVGILSTNIAYATHQYKWGRHAKRKNTGIVLAPSYSQHAMSMYFAMKL